MITIVIPAYNSERFVGDNLASVVAQTFTDWEAIVVDDGSSDGTKAIVLEWAAREPRLRLVEQANAGPSSARNRGFAESSRNSDYVIFLDNDDVWEETALADLHGELSRRSDVVAAYGLARYIDATGALVDIGELEAHQLHRVAVSDHGDGGAPVPIEAPTTFAVEVVTEAIITAGTVLMKRDAFERSGGWAVDLRIWEDWDLWLRLTRVGPMALIDKPVLRYRRHDANLSGSTTSLDVHERSVRSRLLTSLASSPEYLRIARTGSRLHHHRLIRERLLWAKGDLTRGAVMGAAKQLRHAARLAFLGPVR
ncbi:MAG TPA: glycosyltransferase [Capsulimonadaceae bacterium]|jgi:glycosyltransferase involved in cell wall biosynthesis